MSRFYANTVTSVPNPPLIVIAIAEKQTGWCQQYAEEGYNVIQIFYPPKAAELAKEVKDAATTFLVDHKPGDWALITFGLESSHLFTLVGNLEVGVLKAVVHYCPSGENAPSLLLEQDGADGKPVPTIFHLAASQEALFASASVLTDPETAGFTVATAEYHPVEAYPYPNVSASPPFSYFQKAPAAVSPGEKSHTDAYTRSAVSQASSRTLTLLRRTLGPHYNLEKLWEMHTFYEFVERDSRKTLTTMVPTPYVNHISTLTGGVGHDALSRFYKYHFVQENVTPPDTELITVSRTVGADRVIDELIFKCTHTTEIDYFLPGIKPTGKPLEIAVVGIVAFRGDKLFFEYWDQASVLVQLGLLNPEGLPVAGVEVARKVVDPFGIESNKLMAKWKESEGLPI